MDFLLLIPLCLGMELFYLMRVRWMPALSAKGRLVLSSSAYIAVVVFCLLVAHFDRDNFRGDGIYLPRMGFVLKGWAVSTTLLVGTLDNLVLSIVAVAKHPSTTFGNRVLQVLLVVGMTLPVPLVLWGPRWYRHQVAQREYRRRLDHVLEKVEHPSNSFLARLPEYDFLGRS